MLLLSSDFFQNQLFQKNISGHHHNIKWSGSRPGPKTDDVSHDLGKVIDR